MGTQWHGGLGSERHLKISKCDLSPKRYQIEFACPFSLPPWSILPELFHVRNISENLLHGGNLSENLPHGGNVSENLPHGGNLSENLPRQSRTDSFFFKCPLPYMSVNAQKIDTPSSISLHETFVWRA